MDWTNICQTTIPTSVASVSTAVGSGKYAYPISLTLCNSHSSALTVNLYVVPSGDSPGDTNQFLEIELDAGGSFSDSWAVPGLSVLSEGDTIQGVTTVANKVSIHFTGGLE